MSHIDDIASISAVRHARKPVVTASTDSVDFLHPIQEGQSVCLEAFVTWTHKTSLEVFVKVVGEDLLSGKRRICATAFLTFVAVDKDGEPQSVPAVLPETDLEKELFNGAAARSDIRKQRRVQSKKLAGKLGVSKPWMR